MTAAARRPYSILRLYVPTETFSDTQNQAVVDAGLDHDALESHAVSQELSELLMSADERRENRLTRTTAYRTITWDGRSFVSPEQPEARLPETARSLYQDVGEEVFSRIVSPESLAEAHESLTDEPDEENFDTSARYMWAGSAAVPISWLILFADENAPPVSSEGLLREDLLTARRRIREAILTMTWATLPTEIVDELSRTESWLTPHERGIVELDYGAAARILNGDDSPRDLGIALAALSERDTVTAVAAYRRFDLRWRAVSQQLHDAS